MNILNEGIRVRFPIINNPMNYIYVVANVPKVLKKSVIEESDLYPFKVKYSALVNDIIFQQDEFLKTEILNRMDYKFDYRCKDKVEKDNLLGALSKGVDTRYSAKKNVYEKNGNAAISVYYNSKGYRINIYDKYEESHELPEYENVVRYEVQILSRMLNRYLKNYGLIREIDNYWNLRDYFFKEYLLKLFYAGDYYKNNILSKKMSHLKNKEILYEKVQLVQKSDSVKGIFSYSQLQQLQEININPLQNNFNLENPLNEIINPIRIKKERII